MNRSLIKIFTPFLFIFCFFIFTTKANACSCTPPIIIVPGDKTSLEDKIKQEVDDFEGAIFQGKVVKIETFEKDFNKVTFEIKKYWKGVSGKEITISTFSGEEKCGIPFRIEKTYFVAARETVGCLPEPHPQSVPHEEVEVFGENAATFRRTFTPA